jgi:hypothetical protein
MSHLASAACNAACSANCELHHASRGAGIKFAAEQPLHEPEVLLSGLIMVRRIALDTAEIVSGKPLPFSIFDPSRNRLVASQGQMVTERLRASLLLRGLMAFTDDDSTAASSPAEASDFEAVQPLLQLRLQYARASVISRSGFRLSREDGGESYTCRVVGSTEQRGLILTAPMRDDGSYVEVSEGQTWQFRTLYSTAAIRFAAVVGKVVTQPFPYFHVEVPPLVEMRHIRKVQRVATCVNAVLRLSHPAEAVIVDLSATGMQIATDLSVRLQESHRFKAEVRVTVLGKPYDLGLDVDVVRCLGAADPRHPQVIFYGLGIEAQTELERMVLHAFVQSCVIEELDALSKILAG